jgi:hypothetical protein
MSRISHMAAYDMAIELVKKAGFQLDHVSRQTETCYFYHPSRRPLLMRVSAHKNNGSPLGLNNVLARVSFSYGEHMFTPTIVTNRVTWAIGQYFLGDPRPSKYKGKKGTWEGLQSPQECATQAP